MTIDQWPLTTVWNFQQFAPTKFSLNMISRLIRVTVKFLNFHTVHTYLAESKKMSGAGFPFFKSEWLPVTTWSKRSKTSRWFLVFSANVASDELVAIAIGIPLAFKCLMRRAAPSNNLLWAYRGCTMLKKREKLV